MRIAISGASGFVGRHLTTYLRSRGFEVEPLGRDDFADGARDRLARLVARCDAVVNLAGAPIARRWCCKYKEELYASRVETTRRLVWAINSNPRTTTLISASAVGYYPSVGCYDEFDDARGRGFLAELCAAWESAARPVDGRCVIARLGVVLSPAGGAFLPLSRPAKSGVAVVAGDGTQSFSWIDLGDLVRAIEFLLTSPELDGVFNLTAPDKVTLGEFMQAVAAHYDARFTVHAPAFALRLLRGESANFMLEGQCVEPTRLLCAGFHFESSTVADFLHSLKV